jgi:CubicO group peptidase (beta-lactamase class C family)
VAQVIEAARGEGVAPAVDAAVLRGGAPVHLGACGDAQVEPDRVPLAPGDLFDVASLTKVVATGTLAALLVGEGRLGLEDRVADRLPGFEAAGKGSVTVRQLLAHASGLPAWRPYFEAARADPVAGAAFLPPARRPAALGPAFARGRALVRDAVIREPLEAPPGTRARYGDPAFLALGWIVEGAGGAPLDRLFAERVARPLRLADTLYVDAAGAGGPGWGRSFVATERCPHRHEVNRGAVNDDNAWAVGGVAGHAGLFSTAREVAALGQAWLDALRGRRGLLDPAVARAFAERDAAPESTRALAWDTPSAGRSSLGTRLGRGPRGALGHLAYTGCSLWVDRDAELVCALLTNHVHPGGRDPERILGFRRRFHDAVAESLGI